MIYVLVLILGMNLNGKIFYSGNDVSRHETMIECFEAREKLVESLGRPIVNYQAICVLTSK